MKAIKLIAIFLGIGVILFVSLNFDTLRMVLSDDAQMKRQLKELREQHLSDSTKLLEYQQLLRSQADSIAVLRQKIAKLQEKSLKSKSNNNSQFEVTHEQEEADILAAINSGASMSKIENMPGYRSFIQKYSKQYSSFKYAVPWVVDYDILLGRDRNGCFMCDKTKKHDSIIARDIKSHILNKKGTGWTAKSIIQCHKDISRIMNQAEPIK